MNRDLPGPPEQATETPPEFTCGPRYFTSTAEYRDWFRIRSQSFGDWYVPSRPDGWDAWQRRVENAHAALFPEFLHQLRAPQGQPVGYLVTVPGHWSGVPESLQRFGYIDETLELGPRKLVALTVAHLVLVELLGLQRLFQRLIRPWRDKRLGQGNAVFLVAISIDPTFRKHRLPTRLIGMARESARRLGYRFVAGPFRPNGYGAFKAQRRVAHTDELFLEYCALKTPECLPVDPWFRAVVRMGATLVRAMPASFVLKRSLATFERFRQQHSPQDWYSPATDVWECGETCTWYLDHARGLAVSVEPNYWGVIPLNEP